VNDCKHDAVSTRDPFTFNCRHCGVPMCTDCGTTPAHEDGGHYCRYCREKAGYPRDFVTEIDHDKLRAKVGRELAEQILNECRS
jgi:hypothetical protein